MSNAVTVPADKLAELQRDAARYRWLRDAAHPDTNGGLRCVGNSEVGGVFLHISGRDLDRAVDAASAGVPGTDAPEPPPECKTEAEKIAFAFGWWKALEAQRTRGVPEVEAPSKPVGWLDSFGELHKRREDAWDGDPDSTPPRPVYEASASGVMGMDVKADPSLTPGTVEARDSNGKVLGRIVGVKVPAPSGFILSPPDDADGVPPSDGQVKEQRGTDVG